MPISTFLRPNNQPTWGITWTSNSARTVEYSSLNVTPKSYVLQAYAPCSRIHTNPGWQSNYFAILQTWSLINSNLWYFIIRLYRPVLIGLINLGSNENIYIGTRKRWFISLAPTQFQVFESTSTRLHSFWLQLLWFQWLVYWPQFPDTGGWLCRNRPWIAWASLSFVSPLDLHYTSTSPTSCPHQHLLTANIANSFHINIYPVIN
jgi:hypothetical protein